MRGFIRAIGGILANAAVPLSILLRSKLKHSRRESLQKEQSLENLQLAP